MEIDNCAICLCPMAKGAALFTSECSHKFHYACIGTVRVCPICRDEWKQPPGGDQRGTPRPRRPQWRPVFGNHQQVDDDVEAPDRGSSSNSSTRSLELSVIGEVHSIKASEYRNDYTALIHIKAPKDEDVNRVPIDLVTVLDVSGSMRGAKLELVKTAMEFIISNLRAQDRLSVVSFSDEAYRVLPLKRMADQGKESAKVAMRMLRSLGGTNIAEGLRAGFEVLSGRTSKNPVASIMLLTDGQDNYRRGPGNGPRPIPVESYLPSTEQDVVPVHTFGFGFDHDPVAMNSISEATHGGFRFVEEEGTVQDAFAQCIGGLLSVFAQDVEITIDACSGAVINGVEVSGTSSLEGDRRGVVQIGTLYAEEERDILVQMSLPPSSSIGESMKILHVEGKFKDAAAGSVVSIPQAELLVPRPEIVDQQRSGVVLEVDRQKNRVIAAKAMAAARAVADAHQLEGAKSCLLEAKFKVEASAAFAAQDMLSLVLVRELLNLMEMMEDSGVTNSWRAHTMAGVNVFRNQRAAVSRDGGRALWTNETASMSHMVRASRSSRGVEP